MDLQLLVDILQVEGDGLCGNVELCRGRFVTVAFGEELQQANLVRRQVIVGPFGWMNLAKQPDHAACNIRRHRSASRHGLLNTFEQLSRRRLLEQIAGRSPAERIECSSTIAEYGMH